MAEIQKATTDVVRYINIVDSVSGAPETGITVTTLDMQYTRALTAAAAKVDAIVGTGGLTTHVDNKIVEVDATSSPGLYMVCWPDAAFATGVSQVQLVVTGTGFAPAVEEIQLVAYDPEDAVRLGLTALPNAAADAAGGLAISDAGGLDLDTQLAATNEVTAARMGALTDWINGGRLDLILDDILADTNELQSDDVPGLIAALNDPTVAAIADGVHDEATAGHTSAGTFGAQLKTVVDAIQTAANAIQAVTDLLPDAGALTTIGTDTARLTAVRAAVLTDWIDGGRLDLLLDAVKAVTDLLPDAGALTTIGTDTARLTAARAEALTDWIDGGRLDLLLDAITTHLTDVKGATFSGATDSLEAIRDRGDAAWTTGAGGSDRLLMVDTTIATLASQTSFTLTAGSADNNAYRNCTIVIEDASTATQKAIGLCSAYVGASKTITLKYDPAVFTMAATDKVYILAENALKSSLANRQLDVTGTGAAGIDWGNVENPTTAVDLSATDIQLCDTVSALTGHTVQTGDNFARLGAPAGASVSADIAVIEGQTDDIGVAGAGLTDLGGMSTGMMAEIESEVNDALDTVISELGVAAPTATPTLRTGLMLLYMVLRNKLVVQTSGTDAIEVYNNAGTLIASKLITDDGSDYTEAEMV